MRLMIAMCLIVSSLSAFGSELVSRKFSFTYFGSDVGSRTFYSCDSAEDMLRDRLVELGAQNVRVSCFGGIENWGGTWNATPVSLTARFMVPGTRANAQRLVIMGDRFNSNCDFNVQMMNKLLKNLPNARMVSRKSSCRGARGSWSYTVDAAL